MWNAPSIATNVRLRGFRVGDRTGLFNLLRALPQLYPGGGEWLGLRLDDVLAGRALCTVAMVAEGIVGTLIETPKGRRAAKVSTLCVASRFRRLGVATALLRRHGCMWERNNVDRVTLTVPLPSRADMVPFLINKGFNIEAVAADRYGPGRDETILVYDRTRAPTPDLDVAASAVRADDLCRAEAIRISPAAVPVPLW